MRFDQVLRALLPPRAGGAALFAMKVAAGSEVVAEALAAPVLASLTAAVERRLGQVARTPRAVAPGCVGVDARRRWRRWRWGRPDITNPDPARPVGRTPAPRD